MKLVARARGRDRFDIILDKADLFILKSLSTNGPTNITDIDRIIHLPTKNRITHTNRLISNGLISITNNKENKKFKDVKITNKGIQLVKLLSNRTSTA